MNKLIAMSAAAVTLAGCVVGDLPFGVTRAQIFEANTPQELIELGGVQVMGHEIEVIFPGLTFVEPNENWTWDINADGTHHARDNDGEWADAEGGTWQVVENEFCRENEDLALKCSEVYRAGPYYRLTEPDGRLALWTMTPKAP